MAGEAVIRADFSAWDRLLDRVQRGLRAPASLVKAAFLTHGYKDVIEHFKNEEGPDGKWPRRSDFTQQLYARLKKYHQFYDPSNKLLQLTGKLRQSLMQGQSNIREHSKGVMFFSNAEYSGKHDRGEDGMPQRKFMWLSDAARKNMGELIVSMLLRK